MYGKRKRGKKDGRCFSRIRKYLSLKIGKETLKIRIRRSKKIKIFKKKKVKRGGYI